MKITRTESGIVAIPADPAPNGWLAMPGVKREFIILTIFTDEGIDGIGMTYSYGPMAASLKAAVDGLCSLIIGMDALSIESVVARLRQRAGSNGPGGTFSFALAAIDIALWDIRGKAANLPVSKLAGGFRDSVPVYASGALMREYSIDHILSAGSKLIEQGFRQLKTQLALPGPTSVSREVERIRLIRESIGDDIDLMCDINQLWDERQAISIGHRIEEFNLYWLEDVVAHDDFRSQSRVRNALVTPIAGGEPLYGISSFRGLLEAGAVDVVMIDVLRAGGITQWLKIAAMAEAFNVPVSSHLMPELHVHLVAAVPNGLNVEYMPWSSALFENPPKPVHGEIRVPNGAGLGLKFDANVLKQQQR